MSSRFSEIEHQFDTVFQERHIVREINRTNDGIIYEVQKETANLVSKAALKHVSIPKDQRELEEICCLLGTDDRRILRDFLYQLAQGYQKAYSVMRRFDGYAVIMSFEAFQIQEKMNMPGYDIFIQTELLQDVGTLKAAKGFGWEEIISMGKDICKALEVWEQKGIVHNNIRPDNIFRDNKGNYKLGGVKASENVDFWIDRESLDYSAPDIVSKKDISPSTDLYSLGLVMYQLANDNRLPFQEAQGGITSERDKATRRRISGEKLPAPAWADPLLTKIILKACEYNPRNRYQHAAEMRGELERLSDPNSEDTIPQRSIKQSDIHAGKSHQDSLDHNILLGGEENIIARDRSGRGGGRVGFRTIYIAAERKVAHEIWVYEPLKKVDKRKEEIIIPDNICTEKELKLYVAREKWGWLNSSDPAVTEALTEKISNRQAIQRKEE